MFCKNDRIYECILDEIMKDKNVTQKRIAKNLNASERTIRRYMKDLRTMGIISLEISGKTRIWKIT